MKLPIYQISTTQNGEYQVELNSAITMPNAVTYLWNELMMTTINCRGYVNSTFMQPEPSKYAFAQNMEAQTFIQPELNYYAGHPGRFFYIKESNKPLFSLPFAPINQEYSSFKFVACNNKVYWLITHHGLAFKLTLTLAEAKPEEHWRLDITNHSNEYRELDIYPYFPIGYMSWLNQSASYDKGANSIIARSITPYQKVEQYFENQSLKDITFFTASEQPCSWTANQSNFEGFGGLTSPQAIINDTLGNIESRYEVPTAAMQFKKQLAPKQTASMNFIFGAAKCRNEVVASSQFIKSERATAEKYLSQPYSSRHQQVLNIQTDTEALDAIINQWLPRQICYQHELNRLTTDPQTRNYLQDNLGMIYIAPHLAREAFIKALSQQMSSGAMPDGILLHDKAQLKYINQVPHADHSVWLPIFLLAYLNETNDKDLLHATVPFYDKSDAVPVAQHIEKALDHLIEARDHRELSLIEQGDWCDPMNMVGHKGKGVSAWLSMATAYAIDCWTNICQYYLPAKQQKQLDHYRDIAKRLRVAINEYFWRDNWYARGLTDGGDLFGIASDQEGQIYLNAQSWAMLANACSKDQQQKMLMYIEEKLTTPFGVMMLAPAYTKMREDIGRLTQKHPGVAENGSVYNHAAAFYIYSLYQIGEKQKAYQALTKMLPNLQTAEKTGQLPVFIPNYYRGAFDQLPEHAGRSSQLIHTGTVSWIYRCIIEELCGLKGNKGELMISPQLPTELAQLSGTRQFMGATFIFNIEKHAISNIEILMDGNKISGNIINGVVKNKIYNLEIRVPIDE